MATELYPPIITLSGDEFLAADFNWGEAFEGALSHQKFVNGTFEDVTLGTFEFFDASGQRITVNDPFLATVTLDADDHTAEVRQRVASILRDRAAEIRQPNPFPEIARLADLADDHTVTLEYIALWLAAGLRTSSTIDPHRRGFWHNVCHPFFRHR
jgi:hypothetical protein